MTLNVKIEKTLKLFEYILFLNISEHIMYQIDTYGKSKRNVKTPLNQDSPSHILV